MQTVQDIIPIGYYHIPLSFIISDLLPYHIKVKNLSDFLGGIFISCNIRNMHKGRVQRIFEAVHLQKLRMKRKS